MCVQTPKEIKQDISEGSQWFLANKAKLNRQQVLPQVAGNTPNQGNLKNDRQRGLIHNAWDFR